MNNKTFLEKPITNEKDDLFNVTSYVEELENIIESYFKKGKRAGITFLTQNGKPNERLQGIITPWDIISASK